MLLDYTLFPKFSHTRKQDMASQAKLDLENGSIFSDTVKLTCLMVFPWRGHFYRADMTPPAHFIPDIFSALEESSTFPTEFDFFISPPSDLTVLEISSEQLDCIRYVLHKVKRVNTSIHPWAQQCSLAVDNNRPYSEIQHLGNLTRAFCDVEGLEKLILLRTLSLLLRGAKNLCGSQILPLQT